MQCPNCYNKEWEDAGFSRVTSRSYLTMERVCIEDGYEYFQCPRCLRTRKQRIGWFSNGPIEEASPRELTEILGKNSEGSALGGVLVAGAAILLAGLFIASLGDEKNNSG